MPIQTYFRATYFAQKYVQQWLKAIFYAAEKEQIVLTDGTKKIEFSNTPYVSQADSWDEQQLPAALIANTTGRVSSLSISKDFTGNVDDEITTDDQYRHVGGDIIIDMSLSIKARNIPECDKLADIVGLHLAHPDAKDFLGQHNIVVETLPSIGTRTRNRQQGDFDIYSRSISYGLRGQWDYRSSVEGARLSDIVVTVLLEMDL